MLFLHTLDSAHPNRTRPLVGCWYRWRNGKQWKQVTPGYKIAHKCYNDLGPAWTNDLFSFDDPTAAKLQDSSTQSIENSALLFTDNRKHIANKIGHCPYCGTDQIQLLDWLYIAKFQCQRCMSAWQIKLE